MIMANAGEGIVRQLSPVTGFSQAAGFMYGHAMDPVGVLPSTYAVQNSFTVSRGFWKDTVGGTLTNGANIFTASQPIASLPITPGQVVYVNTLTANYTHPFTESLTTTLTAGITQTINPSLASAVEVQPTGTATLAYAFDTATAALSYAHQAMPDIATATVSFADMVSVRFRLPLGVTGLTASGSAGYSRIQPPTSAPTSVAAANALSTANVIVGDVSLAYQPRQLETLTFGMRGQVTRQFASGDISDVSAALADDFTRYTVSLNVMFSYPRADAAQARPSFTPVYSVEPPTPTEITSTDRYYGAPVAGPAPEEPAPKPVKAP